MKIIRDKFFRIMVIVGCSLLIISLLPPPASVYHTRCKISLGARRVRDTNNLTSSLCRVLIGIGYEEYKKKIEEISALIEEIFPELDELRSLSPEDKITRLASMIKDKIETYEDGIFKLQEVLDLKNRKANCFGYSQLVYVMGKALGLNVEIIPVCPGHAANLIEIDTGYVILDLARNYQSPIFIWEETYDQEANIWRLKEEGKLSEDYKIIRRISEKGIIVMI
ncbi:MAG: hypothetical protein NTZ48_06515 [Candidatus Omnitrophica bacterium]|nr:hypothetical protein [Candidatus Omnitrophota bacterium]